jgi:hypothetical protein
MLAVHAGAGRSTNTVAWRAGKKWPTRVLEKKGQSLFVLVPAFPPEVGGNAGRHRAK